MMRIERRDFLAGLLGTVAVSSLGQRLSAAAVFATPMHSSLAGDPRRPQFHLLPTANWMNDPNGPIYYRGKYHMFYQYNPNGAFWGDMHWGHAISADMVHWKHLPVALAPTQNSADADGCYSGTTVMQDGRAVILYTGVRLVPEVQATIKEGTHSMRETQCMAIANDAELCTWTKLSGPVIAAPPPGLAVTGFRDPSPWRQGDWWYMTIGSGIEGEGGAVLLYKSKDLRQWEYLHILVQREGSIALVTENQAKREVWECPEFFALGKKHLLIYSSSGKTYWMAGKLDSQSMQFKPETTGVLDYGSFYAPKTQLDKTGKRILWGWIVETRKAEEQKAAGWAGLMSLPRVLTLRDDGRLEIGVAAEVEQLRQREQSLRITADEKENRRHLEALRVENCCGEILCTVLKGGPFALTIGSENESWLTLKYDPQHPGQILVDGALLPLEEQKELELQLYLDSSVIELFVNRQVAFTKRFYFSGNAKRAARLQWDGNTTHITRLSVWQLDPISTDRLTT